jgi:L-arabinokinase
MGGIADYSGSVVLEMPIAEAAYAFLQPRTDGRLRIRSIPLEADAACVLDYETSAGALGVNGKPVSFEEAAARFQQNPSERWATYLAGCWPVLASARPKTNLSGGANLLLVSEVPQGAGVSSSAAIEVATMRALTSAYEVEMDGMELAVLCQTVENRMAGAPCGIMDQVTSALGRNWELLALKCQPHEVVGFYGLPGDYTIAGLNSGIKHSVGGSQYTKVRVAAFMGYRILMHQYEENRLGGSLANLEPIEYRRFAKSMLPETITGSEFLHQYEGITDPVTQVNPDEVYHVRACAEHPILENARVQEFIRLIEKASQWGIQRPKRLLRWMQSAGKMMYESHSSYSDNCQLGSKETDFLVEQVKIRGIDRGLFGAKITGGGSGGTVAILMQANQVAEDALGEVCQAFSEHYGLFPYRFYGSSPGAMDWPTVQGSL